jgi:hypothetical protein
MDNSRTIKVGVYGASAHAREKHLPNLKRLHGRRRRAPAALFLYFFLTPLIS